MYGGFDTFLFTNAKSKLCTDTCAGSLSSSSVAATPSPAVPVPLPPMKLSAALFGAPPASFDGLLSGVLSISWRTTPDVSWKPPISATFVNTPNVPGAIVVVTVTCVLAPAANGPAIVRVAVLPAPAVHVASFSVKPTGK